MNVVWCLTSPNLTWRIKHLLGTLVTRMITDTLQNRETQGTVQSLGCNGNNLSYANCNLQELAAMQASSCTCSGNERDAD